MEPLQKNQNQSSLVEWTVLRCGIAGVAVLGMIVGIKLLGELPRLFTNSWTWSELLILPFQICILGFTTGVVLGIVLPLARIGRLGYGIIGAVCGNVYLLLCFILFETQALLNPRLDCALALAGVATMMGGGLGLAIGTDLRTQQHNVEKVSDPPNSQTIEESKGR